MPRHGSSAYSPGHNSVPAAGQNGGVEAAAPGTKARHSAPAGYGEWAVTAERERVLSARHRLDHMAARWCRILPHVSAGQPVLMLQAHFCGLADVRHDNTFHLRTFLNGSVIFMGDLIVDEEGSDVRMPLIGSRAQMEEAWGGSGKMPSLETGVHEVVLQLWVGPRGAAAQLPRLLASPLSWIFPSRVPGRTRPAQRHEFWGRWTGEAVGLQATRCRRAHRILELEPRGKTQRTRPADPQRGAGGGVYSEVRCSGGIQEFSFPLLRASDPKFWGTLADQAETCQHSPHHARQVCVCVCVCVCVRACVFARARDLVHCRGH